MATACLALVMGLAVAAQGQDKGKETDYGNNLTELPQGEQQLAGVKFKIGKGLIQLGSCVLPGKPDKVDGIKVDRQFSRLHVLHATGNTQQDQVPDGTLVARYTVHYADGTIDSLPVVYGKNIREWWFFEGAETGVTDGKIAWQGKNRSASKADATIGLYLLTWDNPRPELKVVSIDLISRPHVGAALFCVAMTVEGKAGKDVAYLDLQPKANQRLDRDFHLDSAERAPAEAKGKQATKYYVDEDYGFKVAVPGRPAVRVNGDFSPAVIWQRRDPKDYSVDAHGGEIIRVWAPLDNSASLVVFIQRPSKTLSARALLDAYAVTEIAGVGAEVWKKELRTVAARRRCFSRTRPRGRAAPRTARAACPPPCTGWPSRANGRSSAST
jgi:hypothetical protein